MNEQKLVPLFIPTLIAILVNQWGEDSISAFLESCSELYKRKSSETKLVFYSWLDEKASQIRISAVSQSHGKLPFRNKIPKVD